MKESLTYNQLFAENAYLKEEIEKLKSKLERKTSQVTELGKRFYSGRFFSVHEHVNDVIYKLSIEKGGYEYISPKAYDVFGYRPDEIVNNPMLVRKLIHPDSFQYFKKYWKKLYLGKVPHFYEFKVIKKNGEIIWVQQRNLVIRDKQGKPIAIEGVVTDITEKKLAEEALVESEMQKRAFLNNLYHLAWLKNNKGVYVIVNEAFARSRKRSINEIIGKTDFDIYSKKWAEKYTREDLKIIETRKPIIVEEKTRNKWHETFKAPIINENNQVVGITGISLEITKRKKAEEEIKSYSKRITEQNEILRIINDELVKAKDKAEESDRLKSAFLANMSHEIRTPMNAILGFSTLLKSKKYSEERKKNFIEIINSKSRQLLQIITDIIDISKIEAGQIKIINKNFSLNQLIDQLVVYFQTLIDQEKKPIEIKTDYEFTYKNSWIYSDRVRIEQIITNLLSNAYKFTEKGQIKVGYRLEGNFIILFVSDTGVGLNEEEQKIVFDRFRQATGSSNKIYGGTGLGLSISKGLAEKLGGQIWVESETDVGSIFYLKIPYSVGERIKQFIIKRKEAFNWENKIILVAEDEDINYSFIETIINPTNAKLIRAKNGLEAVDFCRQNTAIDLVLMDIKLPELDGFQATREIRKFRKTLPIIAQTAYAMSSDEETCLKAGCDAYIAKPIKIDPFLKTIEQFL